MAIEKQIDPVELTNMLEGEQPEGLEIEIINPDAVSIEDEDGGVSIILDPDMQEDILGPDHDSNLAEFIEEGELQSIASDLIESFLGDRNSRKEWAQGYIKGLDLLGMKIEERDQPWPGACGVFHPVLTEAVVRFQAQAIMEMFPASGPVRTQVLGEMNNEVNEQAVRIENEMNYQLTERMTDYRNETEQLLFQLPLAGSAFRKVYFDPMLERPEAIFVPAEDFIVSYGASDLSTCERYTQVMKKSENEVLKLQVNGFYRDIELPPAEEDMSDIQEKYDDLDGESYSLDDDDRRTLLEMHVDIDLPEPFDDENGIARPYVITIDKTSREILSIRRNWYEDDTKKRKRDHFVHYKYLPGMGFYGFGLIHLIGGLAKSATSILRQLVDAGTLANLPAGLKTRGLRIKGDDSPLSPGEFRDVDVPGGAIRDNIYPLPYKEPSSVLYQLLGNIVEEGRRIGSVADLDVGNMSANAPVGTTLALLERSMKVMSAVQARLHASLRRELKLIAGVIHDYMPPEYDYYLDGQYSRTMDFDGRVDVVPVSDPNAATMSQRVVQYQAALQLAQQSPQFYDMAKLHRQMLEVLDIKDADEIVKLPEEIKPMDPVSENMATLNQEAIKAFDYQDHEAHIQVHMAFIQDPKIRELVGQSPFAGQIQAALVEHMQEHVAFQYRREIEKQLGVPLPKEKTIPEDVERDLSPVIAKAAQKLLQKDEAEAAQMEAEKQAKDPLTQIQNRELSLKEAEFEHKKNLDLAKLQIESKSKEITAQIDQERIASMERQEGARLGVKIATEQDKLTREDIKDGVEIGLDIAKQIGED
tara:strand:+ start:4223 stop:6664 length:2442 start_codon:yes stop_codon:yes gene_type:complete